MENIMVFDDKMKTKLGFMCFMPALAFFICLVFYLLLLSPLTLSNVDPTAASALTLKHYDVLLVMIATSGLIGAAVLIYCIVILARIKHINAPTKLIWLIMLCAFVPVSVIMFWFQVINKEPEFVPVYPNID